MNSSQIMIDAEKLKAELTEEMHRHNFDVGMGLAIAIDIVNKQIKGEMVNDRAYVC